MKKNNSKTIVINTLKKIHNISKDKIDAMEFIYWLTCLYEMTTTRILWKVIGLTTEGGNGSETESVVRFCFQELGLMGKIKTLEYMFRDLKDGEDKKIIKKMIINLGKLNELRNNIAHYKFDRLVWREEPLSSEKVRSKMIDDFLV